MMTPKNSVKKRTREFGTTTIDRAIRWLSMSATILLMAAKEYRNRDKFLPGDFINVRNPRSSVYKCPAYSIQNQAPSMISSGSRGVIIQKLASENTILYEVLIGNAKYRLESRFLTAV